MTTRQAPAPLSTLELQKKCTSILRMSGDQVMAAAESLYQKGLVSYPRTETDEFDQAQDVQVRPQGCRHMHHVRFTDNRHTNLVVSLLCELCHQGLLFP